MHGMSTHPSMPGSRKCILVCTIIVRSGVSDLFSRAPLGERKMLMFGLLGPQDRYALSFASLIPGTSNTGTLEHWKIGIRVGLAPR